MTNTIKTRPDGSIDTAFYMARGRQMRSQQAHRLAKSGTRRSFRLLPSLALAGLAALLIAPGLF